MGTVRLPLLGDAQSRTRARARAGDAATSNVRSIADAARTSRGATDGSAAGEDEQLMQIGDLAKETGKTIRALHLYEELALLHPAARSKGRFRLYGKDALLRVRWIGKLQDMGFSLSDIQTVVRQWERQGERSAPGSMVSMRDVYKAKLLETRETIAKLVALEHELQASLEYLDTCDVCDPARLLDACNCCDLHDKEITVPELVAGFRLK